MGMVKWDPLSELRAMQEQMARLLERSQGRTGDEPLEGGLWHPPADIYEDDAEVILKMEVPEVDLDDIDVQIEDFSLVIRGVRRLEREEKQQYYQRIERSYGPFKRVFSLPAAVDPERIRASCDKGVLKIMLPKKTSARPRHIEIEVE